MSDDVIKRILEEGDLSQEELETKVKKKIKKFSGLVSKEGAARLVAKDEGLELAKPKKSALKIENVVPGIRQVNLKAKVTSISDVSEFERDDGSKGKVVSLTLSDETGQIRLPLWDEQTELADKISQGDIIAIEKAYSREGNRGSAELRLGKASKVKKAESAELDEIATSPHAPAGGSSPKEVSIRGVRQRGQNYSVRGCLVQLYTKNARYRSCPECNKKVKQEDGSWVCDEHGEVEPEKSLVISGIVDDGTDNIRCVFFRDRARKLLALEEDGDVDQAADKALGQIIRVNGRAQYNDFFDALELVVNQVSFPDVESEVKQLLGD